MVERSVAVVKVEMQVERSVAVVKVEVQVEAREEVARAGAGVVRGARADSMAVPVRKVAPAAMRVAPMVAPTADAAVTTAVASLAGWSQCSAAAVRLPWCLFRYLESTRGSPLHRSLPLLRCH